MGDSAEVLMSHAKRDLSLAEEMSSDDDIHPYGRAFHSQQAAEKAMKAVIITSGRRPKWTWYLWQIFCRPDARHQTVLSKPLQDMRRSPDTAISWSQKRVQMLPWTLPEP